MSQSSSLPIKLYFTLRHTYHNLKTELRKKLEEEEDITWSQFHTLYHLNQKGVPFNQLARKIHCNASNVTGLIDRMEDNGWVYRERSQDDRRVWLVKLTESGAELRGELIPEHKNNIRGKMNLLSEEEQKTFKRLLDKLNS